MNGVLTTAFINYIVSTSYLVQSYNYGCIYTRSELGSGCRDCACGIPNKKGRIVGGWMTGRNEFPWMVALVTEEEGFFCGGSLINDRYVLTAAHCVGEDTDGPISIILGAHDKRNLNNPNIEKRLVEKIIIYPTYDAELHDSDIALLKLASKVKFKKTIQPICLPLTGSSFAGYLGTILGWGLTDEGGKASDYLLQTQVRIITNEECSRKGYGTDLLTNNMMCARGNGRDACQGDSGGPMMLEWDGKIRIIGIVSWGIGCARPDMPGVYARVNHYIDWILQNTRDACYCR